MHYRLSLSILVALLALGCGTESNKSSTASDTASSTDSTAPTDTEPGEDTTAAEDSTAPTDTEATEDTEPLPDGTEADASEPADGTVADADEEVDEDGGAVEECPGEVLCKMLPPDCKAPLIAVPKGDCWGCGYPETCNCSDGMPVVCDAVPPECGNELEMANVGGCFECVDPLTCQAKTPPPKADCAGDEGCMATPYQILVTDVSECFCPMCASWPATLEQHQARQSAWNAICTEWEIQNPCPSPKCANPGTPTCVDGQCQLIKDDPCEGELICDSLPLDCQAPFMTLIKDGCWACGYPDTCSCSMAETPTCKSPVPECPAGSIVAIQGEDPSYTCYECVDPNTCQPVVETECQEKGECTLSVFNPAISVQSKDDCYCLMCPEWPMAQAAAQSLQSAWTQHCADWSAQLPCPDPSCLEPAGSMQCLSGQCVLVESDTP